MKKIGQIFSLICILMTFSAKLNAANDWSSIKTIGSHPSFTPDVAVDRKDDAFAVFVHSDGVNERIQSAVKPCGKPWKTIKHLLSEAGSNAGSPKIAVSGKNSATAVWKLQSDTNFIVQASTYDFKCKRWSKAVDLTGPIRLHSGPIVEVDNRGDALAVWSFFDGNKFHIQSSIRNCGKNNWEKLHELIVDGASNLDLAIDPAGNAILVWEDVNPPIFNSFIQAATLTHDSKSWVLTKKVSAIDLQSTHPKVGVDCKGDAVVVWSEGISFPHIAGAKLPFKSKTWVRTSDPTSLPGSDFPDLAVDEEGNAVTIWRTVKEDFSTTFVAVATLPAKSLSWSVPNKLATSQIITDPKVVVNKQGDALAAWSASGLLQTSSKPFRKKWTPAINLTPSTIGVGGVQVAISPCNFAVIVYTGVSTNEEVVQAIHSGN